MGGGGRAVQGLSGSTASMRQSGFCCMHAICRSLFSTSGVASRQTIWQLSCIEYGEGGEVEHESSTRFERSGKDAGPREYLCVEILAAVRPNRMGRRREHSPQGLRCC